MGGENQQPGLNQPTGHSDKAQHNGKPSYLEPISGSMQKPIEGVYRIGVFRCQNHVEEVARVYLERIRNRMHKPIEGLLVPIFGALYKGL